MKEVLIITACVICVAAPVFGYGANIYKLLNTCDFESPYRAEAIRSVGVFVPPVGMIAGYLTIGD